MSHDETCSCFDCRMRRKTEAENAVEAKRTATEAEIRRQEYIKRRGGEPHVPNKKTV